MERMVSGLTTMVMILMVMIMTIMMMVIKMMVMIMIMMVGAFKRTPLGRVQINKTGTC